MVEELLAHLQEAYGWGEDVVLSPGPRGALGQIWRADVGPARYAVKEIFAEPPPEAAIAAELAFARRAAGPAVPGRELARALFDWFCDGPDADLDAMSRMYEAYLREGGPRRIAEPADFTMLLACRLNFLLVQTRVAADPAAEPRHREWAEREIDEGLRMLPTPRQLAEVLELTRNESERAFLAHRTAQGAGLR